MNYIDRIHSLERLKMSKFMEYRKALLKYLDPNQTTITFKEVNDLKEELDEIYHLLSAVENVYKA